jgi:hypothetical protein
VTGTPQPGHGNGLRMTLEMRDLRKRHNLQVVDPRPMPLPPPLDAPRGAIIKALASESSIDLDRGRFKPGSIRFDPDNPPKLILRHDPDLREVGTIHDLEYRPNGDLIIDVIVTDPVAVNLPGLSVGVTLHRFVLHEEGANPHGEVEEGVLSEISLTEQPANLRCTVQKRRAAEPFDLALLAARRSSRLRHEVMKIYIAAIDLMIREYGRRLNALKAHGPSDSSSSDERLEERPVEPAAPQPQRYARRDWQVGDRINLDASFVADADVSDGTVKGVASAPGVDAYGHVVAAHAFTPRSKERASASRARVASNCWRFTTGRNRPALSRSSRPPPGGNCRSRRSSISMSPMSGIYTPSPNRMAASVFRSDFAWRNSSWSTRRSPVRTEPA